MNDHDHRLRALLQQWRDIQPSGSFEQDVLRRIRVSQPKRPNRPGWMAWVRGLAGRPAFSMAIAVVVALLIGAWAGRHHAPPSTPGFAFLAGDSLAGGYLRLAGGPR